MKVSEMISNLYDIQDHYGDMEIELHQNYTALIECTITKIEVIANIIENTKLCIIYFDSIDNDNHHY